MKNSNTISKFRIALAIALTILTGFFLIVTVDGLRMYAKMPHEEPMLWIPPLLIFMTCLVFLIMLLMQGGRKLRVRKIGTLGNDSRGNVG